MSILLAFVIFDILIIIYEIIVELFSALYELSGLTKEQARFQVTSLLTGTGFTTAESEKMLETKKRKRVTRDIMIISYIFNISIISTLITLFTSAHISSSDEIFLGLAVSLILLLVLIFSKRITGLRHFVDKSFLHIVGLIYFRRKNTVVTYDYYGSNLLAEVKLNKIPDYLKNKTLAELNLEKEHDLHILSVKRKNTVITDIKGNFKFHRKDTILLIGGRFTINKIFQQ